MLISTKIWASISALMLGYLATVVLSWEFTKHLESRLTTVIDSLAPASTLTQQAQVSFRQQTQFYQDAVLQGEPNLFKNAATSALEVRTGLTALRALPSIVGERQQEVAQLLGDLERFTVQSAAVYGSLAVASPDEVTRHHAAELDQETAHLKFRLDSLAKGCSDDMRALLEGTVITTKGEQTFSQILFVVVALTSSTFVILVITRWTRRLKSLLQASERMSLGDFTVPIRDQLQDEVGHLSRSFSLMQDAVHSRGRQLRQFTENLERTIQERTHELSLKNTDLLREIQERERTEFSLRLLESAVNQITDAVMITTPAGGERALEIVYVNPGFTAMTGYEPQEVVGKAPQLLSGEKTDLAHLERLFAEPSAGRNAVGEMINYHKCGSEVLVEWSVVPLRTKAGAIVNLVAVQRDITQRKQAEDELSLMHRQLLDASRRAGMAEVATGVLHNVGNVLNSVNVSATLVCDRLNNSRLVNLGKAVDLIGEHAGELGDFLTRDSRGRQLPTYLNRLSEHLLEDREQTLKELHSLTANIEHIKQIVSLQQSYGKSSGFLQPARPHEIIEEAVRLNSLLLQRGDVKVVLNYQDCPQLMLDRQKILQILVNLIANAQHALSAGSSMERVLTISLARREQQLTIAISDTGSGIAPENLAKIFTHGFTTKKDGHGFGLHYCAIAAKEMQGALLVESGGLGQGATFTLTVPLATAPAFSAKAPGTNRYPGVAG